MEQFRQPETYRAFRVHVSHDGSVTRGVEQTPWSTLPDEDVTVRVTYSALNYKDALSAQGNRGVSREYPHTPGIDAVGTVVASRDGRYAPGQRVIASGFDLGMNSPGGFAEFVRVPGDWLVPLPDGVGDRQAAAIGTAGVTAALALERIEFAGVVTGLGPVAVTGASGGVGSLAVALTAGAGYEVIASSGKAAAGPLLERLGAKETIGREVLAERSERPLLSGAYGGAIDTVGGSTLENLVKSTRVGGAVAACGLVGGAELQLTVHPFILRGVALVGVDSQHLGREARVELWADFARNARFLRLLTDGDLVTEVGLDELEGEITRILSGGVTGRVVVRLS